MILHILLIIFLLIPSLAEGLGLGVDRRISLLYFSTIASFLYIYLLFLPKPIKMPLKAGILYLLFLFFSIVSALFFSLDKQVSFELFLLYYSSFLFFIFFYNQKKVISHFIYYLPVVLGTCFSLYSYILPFFKQNGFNFLLPIGEKQFIFAWYGGHNHLGDYLGLLIIVLLSYCFKKKWVFFFVSIFFYILIVSFSRSAYMALFFVGTFMLFQERKRLSSLFLFIFLLISSFILFMTYLVSMQQPSTSPFYQVQSYINSSLHFSPRDLISGRDLYMKQAILSIQKNPLFGIGGGNFIIASQNNIINNNYSDSAHNVFLELATEQGILATACFLLFSILITKRVFQSPSISGFLFLYLLLNFQTDYIYQIYSIFLFWIILSSVAYSEKEEISIPTTVVGLSYLLPLVVLTCIMTSGLLVKMHRYEGAIGWYSLNKAAYNNSIKEAGKKSPEFIKKMRQLAPYDRNFIIIAADYLIRQGSKKEALRYYESVYETNHLCSFYFIKKIYMLKKELQSQYDADFFLRNVVLEYNQIFASNSLNEEFIVFCKEAKIQQCPKIGWNR